MEITNLIALGNIKNILKNGENYPTRNSPINILKDVVNLVKNLLTIYSKYIKKDKNKKYRWVLVGTYVY